MNKKEAKQFWTNEEYQKLKEYFIKHLSNGEKVTDTTINYAKLKNLAVHQVRCAWYKIKNKERIEIILTEKTEAVQNLEVKNAQPTDDDNIKQITDYYRRHITNYLQPQDEKGLYELYYFCKSRNVDAVKYIIDAIDVFSRKDDDTKKSFGYLVSIVRNWINMGYGHMPTKEDQQLFDIFESILNIKLSMTAKSKLVSLMSSYGMLNLIFYLGKETYNLQNVDISLFYINKFERLIEKYNQKS